MVTREERERRQGHRGMVVWLTGLSGSGKSTLAIALERHLFSAGRQVVLLDGDNIRTGINRGLGFSEADRRENIRRIAEVARLFLDSGHVVISAFISPTAEMRALARTCVGEADFLEVFVDASLEACERRDVKGLYARARAGEIPGFTGIDAPFEAPVAPALHLQTETSTEAESLAALVSLVEARLHPNDQPVHHHPNLERPT